MRLGRIDTAANKKPTEVGFCLLPVARPTSWIILTPPSQEFVILMG